MEVSTISGFFDGSVEGGSSVTLNLQVSKRCWFKGLAMERYQVFC